MNLSPLLKSKIALLPTSSGVYLMKDIDNKIIYIGKAKNLKNRVSQYFLRQHEGKVAAMVSHVHDFDFIIVRSDKEAFILEMNLIQTYYPRYNTVMKDDSHYPYIALKKKDGYLTIARRADKKDYFYFGPFPSSRDAHMMIDFLNKVYPTRKCRTIPKKACLYYHLGQCLAPCIKEVTPEEQEELNHKIRSFLEGNTQDLKRELTQRMKKYSDELKFEEAEEIRKEIIAIENVTSKQMVEITTDKTSRDVISYAARDGYFAVAFLTYRNGRLLGKHAYVFQEFLNGVEDCIQQILQYYQTHEKPKEVITNIPSLKEEMEEIYPDVTVINPKEGRFLKQIEMALINAAQALDEHFLTSKLSSDNEKILKELGELLHIDTPYRIELFDNSHLQGSDAVGVVTVFLNGEPLKKEYRKFHLAKDVSGDDFHSMEEVVYRRYKRLIDEKKSLPDLILIDGGKTAIEAANNSLNKLNIKINLFGLFKNDKHQTEGIIDLIDQTYPLKKGSPLYLFLVRMQDEVHRFAITFHRSLRNKRMTKGLLSDIKGLGSKRQEAIKKHYPTLESLRKASIEELSQFLPRDVAEKVKEAVEKQREEKLVL